MKPEWDNQFAESEWERVARLSAKKLAQMKLSCPGVGRDKDNPKALQFYFNRRITDDEMRFLHEVMQRAVACMKEQDR